MKNAIVVDLDGTLANVDHRRHLVGCAKPDFDTWYKLCGMDTPNEWCVELICAFRQQKFPIHIVSARTTDVARITYDWLRNCLGILVGVRQLSDVHVHLLRGGNDHTPDVELKEVWLKTFGPENILFVVDDRQRVVDMWRRNGVVCLQCDKWEEYVPTKKAVVSDRCNPIVDSTFGERQVDRG